MEKIYIAKSNTWFKAGTEVELVDYQYNILTEKFGTFKGIYIVRDTPYDKLWHDKGHKVGDEVVMTEMCSYNEFEIYDRLPNEVEINKLATEYIDRLLDEAKKEEVLHHILPKDISIVKEVWKTGFEAGFKYLSNKYGKNELENK